MRMGLACTLYSHSLKAPPARVAWGGRQRSAGGQSWEAGRQGGCGMGRRTPAHAAKGGAAQLQGSAVRLVSFHQRTVLQRFLPLVHVALLLVAAAHGWAGGAARAALGTARHSHAQAGLAIQ